MINIQKMIVQATQNGYQGDKEYIKSLDKSDKRKGIIKNHIVDIAEYDI